MRTAFCRGVNRFVESRKSAASFSAGNRKGDDVGSALKTVYDRTLKEAIPPEMLDLLGKLGLRSAAR